MLVINRYCVMIMHGSYRKVPMEAYHQEQTEYVRFSWRTIGRNAQSSIHRLQNCIFLSWRDM